MASAYSKNKGGEGSGKTGPKPETVKIEGDWENAVGKSLEKKRPTGGWPKHTGEDS